MDKALQDLREARAAGRQEAVARAVAILVEAEAALAAALAEK